MIPSFRPCLGSFSTFVVLLLTFSQLFTPSLADGYGMLGAGKWLYKPVCGHTCRRLIYNNPLLCDGDNATTHVHRRHLHGATNPPECFLKDAAFLRTMALCLAKACPRDNIPNSVIEEYWEGHLATGSVGDWSLHPIMSYQEALMHAQQDVEEIGEGNVPYAIEGEPLNVTSFVRDEDLVQYHNAQTWFERLERDHGRNGIAVAVSGVFIPILLSLFRFLPIHPLWYSRLVAILEKPLVGHRHRSPMVANLGIMPTRGQTLYIAYLVLTQIFLAIFPLVFLFPNSIAPTRQKHFFVLIGNRTGALAMADFVALFLFSSRNNILLWITNWSHSTFLLLHRWIGYCLIFQVSIHSAIYLAVYYADHATESQQPYWIWGVVGTLAFVVLWPASILPVRQKAYEIFLISHQILAALGLIATFFHIYELFTYNWGYEIWVYIGGAIWFLDRFLRLLRMVATGYRTAVVTTVDPDSEYLKVEIDGIVAHGHVYLYFPTLTWRVWENHPYSVLSTFTSATHSSKAAAIEGHGDPEKTSSSGSSSELSSSSAPGRPKITILLRPMNGLTRVLATRLGQQKLLSIPVIVEGPYHANPAIRNLASCSTLLCIAGGVGITPVIPIIKSFEGVKTRLAWGVRTEWLLRAVDDEIKDLVKRGARVETKISGDANGRFNVGDIVREELLQSEDEGDLGVVVCGPNGMADEVRMVIAELGPKAKRGVVFIDEAFSW
ncbi:hypothetical protein EST38_g10302 [Candolleomyces aberdarensis]|uniref:Ferric oxidoreductase domain-containing protein n=1 Tax=Candolleomyces aberdarensis TaxID=2316362 RepID=A0A4Q2DAM0_9AGAR|nr:hypothetical protein EST38_g10302 [Candolleomyces aberdarensis]